MLIFTHIPAPHSIIVLYPYYTWYNTPTPNLDKTYRTKPHCTFTILQDTPLFHTRPPHYTAFYTLPNHTLTSLLKTLQVSTVTARDHILPYFTQTEQYHTQLYLDGTRQNNTPHYNTIASLCLFQLTITLQYHTLLFSAITKLLTNK